MEWVETTGQSIEEAQAKALDLLNVDGSDAEIEILEDVKKGLFGRVKADARVRARIKPKAPAPKDDRRNRRGGSKSRDGGGRNRGGKKSGNRNSGSRNNSGGGKSRDGGNRSKGGDSGTSSGNRSKGGDSGNSGGNRNKGRDGGNNSGGNNGGGNRNRDGAKQAATAAAGAAAGGSSRKNNSNKNDGRNRDGQPKGGRNREETAVDEEFSVAEQQEIMGAFVGGVAAVFDSGSSTEVVDLGEDTLEAQVSGENLGLLVGPSGATLAALEELTRTALQRSAGGRRYHRIHVDVDQYRSRRREALGAFANTIADQVLDSGERKALEPMSAADRKVVHDALTDVDGVVTLSEGDDPRRFVVIAPA